MRKILIIIPAFNEAPAIGRVIDSLPKKILGISVDVLVIDDGSLDETVKVVRRRKVKTLVHIKNRGLGAALGTGFEYARLKSYDFIVTFDADGQHKPQFLARLLKPLIENKADVVIGSRLLSHKGMPVMRRIVNRLSNFATYLLFNIWTTDSQSGLRGFTSFAIKKIKIKTQKMEVSSEIFKEISRLKLRLKEVPIDSIYTGYSLTKGQRISNAPNVFWKLILHRFV